MPTTQVLSVPTATPVIPPLPAGATYATGPDGKVYVKYATQNSNGQWVQTVSTVVNGALVPILNALFPNGVVPNNNAATTLPNGQVLGGFQTYGGTGTGTGGGGSSNTNTLLIGGAAVAALLLFNQRKTT